MQKISLNSFLQFTVIAGSFIIIFSSGNSAINHIIERYNGLCPGQGPGLKVLLYDGDPQGYCDGIGNSLAILDLIVLIASLSVAILLAIWFHCKDYKKSWSETTLPK